MKIANEMPRDTIAYMWDSQGRRMVLDTGNTLNFFRKYAYAENLDYYPWSSGYDPKVAYWDIAGKIRNMKVTRDWQSWYDHIYPK